MRKVIAIILVLTLIMLNGCSANFVPITGVWVCEELEIFLDFDEEGYGRGTIVIDGELHEIVCSVNPTATVRIRYKKDEAEYYHLGDELMLGKFSMRGRNNNKMIFRLLRDGKEVGKYTFVKQE